MEKIDNIWTIFSEMSKLMGGGGKPGITQGRGTDTTNIEERREKVG